MSMKKLLLLLPLQLFSLHIMAQGVDDVTLVVSGDGATKEEATHVALRSAIEQAYGVFVSANTEILNDELVKDEIATVTSGNVKSFKELSAAALPNGNQMVTLQAVVSTKKLAAYAQSKGASCEFAGATFGANLKLIKLNKENSEKAFKNLVQQCKAIAPYIFNATLEAGNPTADGDLPITIKLHSTEQTYALSDLIISTLSALKLSNEQKDQLYEMKVPSYPIKVQTCNWTTKQLYAVERSGEYTGWYYDAPSMQPKDLKGTFRINQERFGGEWKNDTIYDYTTYYYAQFPAQEMLKAIKQTIYWCVKTNLGDCWQVNEDISKIIVGDKELRNFQDYSPLCYIFNERNIRIPYTYVSTQKIAGMVQLKLHIPVEQLIKISTLELKHETCNNENAN